MTEVTQDQLDSILQQVLEVPDEAREAFLDETCGQHTELRAIVEGMLEAADAENGPLTPAGALSGPLWNELITKGVSAGLEAGDRVAAWRIVRTLGQGGMATVYLAERADGQFEQIVALKVLHPSTRADEMARRFGQERQILASLNHPNIAHLIDGGLMPSGQPYVALEYVDGLPLDTYCERERLSARESLALFMTVARAVGHAHRNLIIHRDIKPSNILVTPEGVPKLLDFGIAKLLDATAPHAAPETRSALHPMTPECASPEQVRGEPLTTASDIYQLGYLLYGLVGGARPYPVDRRNYAAVIEAICHVDPIPPSRTVPGERSAGAVGIRSAPSEQSRKTLAGDVDAIVLKALRKEAEARYHSADDLADDIGRYLQGLPVAARQGTAGYRARKFVRRHRWGVAAAAAFAALVVGFGAVYTIQSARSSAALAEERDAAVFASQRAELANDFLNNLLLADSGGDHSLSAVERLELGAEMIEAQYGEGNPAFAGRMLIELGQQFRGLADINRAVALHEKAYEIGRELDDPQLMAMAQCAAAYAQGTGSVMDAVPARLDEAKHLLARLPEPSPLLRAACLRAEARLVQHSGDYDDAIAHLREAQHILEETGNHFRTDYTTTLNEIGGIYNRTGRIVEALEMAELVLATHERFGRGRTASRLTIMHNISVTHYRLGEVLAAHEIREQIAREAAALEPDGAQPLWFPVSAADVLNHLGRPDEALVALGDSVRRARQMGSSGSWLPTALAASADTHLALGRIGDAAPMLDEAVRLFRQNETRYRGALADAYVLKARLALARGDRDDARGNVGEALSVVGYPDRLSGVEAHRTLTSAAMIELEMERYGQAERYALEALPMAETHARGVDTSAEVGEALLALARARLALGSEDGAEPSLERALRCLTNGLGPEHPLTRQARVLLDGI